MIAHRISGGGYGLLNFKEIQPLPVTAVKRRRLGFSPCEQEGRHSLLALGRQRYSAAMPAGEYA